MTPLVQLGDLVRIEKGKKASQVFERPTASTRRYLQIDDLRPDAKHKFVEPFACPVALKSDVVIAWDGANAGTVSCNLDGHIGSTLAVLRPSKQQLFAPYLSRFLEGKFDYLQKNSTGATVPHVSRDVLENLALPLPSLNEQQRIAGQLEQADRLRCTRRYALELSDSFLPAAFLELFGDPVRNTKGWPVEVVSDVGEVQGGLQLSQRRNELPLKKPYLRVANVQRGYLDLSEIKEIGLTASEFERTRLQRGDLLLVEGNGNPTEVGRAAMWDGSIPECVHQNHLIRVRCQPTKLLSKFLLAQINSKRGLDYFLCHGRTTSGLVTISTGLVNDFPALVPPLPLQQKFAALVKRHEHLRATQREALRQAEHLFQTLLHKAFSEGE